MINIYIYVSILVIYLSICGLLKKAGYNWYLGLIPIYNLVLLFKVLEIHPIIIFVIGILLIVLEDRLFIFITCLMILPFIISDAYGENILIGLGILFLPIIFLPLLAFKLGIYDYNSGSELFTKDNKLVNSILETKYDNGGDKV